ncbi:uncharacterized PE-PGRS family protein PE_PGRS54-like [Peromyscus leucopus]|uniref:uncharacterized PE-PGRS family protein PE_PGRS54-like n=1 Tax=Peromyscus leucopus TaxID=10041 RepID=UPI0018856734|nr:uncharacterized PE-PGRS family protein PE_PGRS54-like [Peromyscus leucopus]
MGRGHPPPSPTLPFCWAGVGGGAGLRLQPRRSGRAGPGKGGTGPRQAIWRALKLTGPGAGGGGGGGSGGGSSFLHGRRRRQERQAWPARRPAQTEGHAVATWRLTGEEEPARGLALAGAKGWTASSHTGSRGGQDSCLAKASSPRKESADPHGLEAALC